MNANQDIEAKGIKKRRLIILSLFVATVFTIIYLEISLVDMILGGPSFIAFFFTSFLPPKLANIDQYIVAVLDTVAYAIIATVISSVLSLVIGLLISEHTNKIKIVRIVVRGFISILRNVPFVIWGSLLVYIFGLGGIVGVLALVLATLGFLGKSYGESIDDIPSHELDALKASGASSFKVLCHGILPLFYPAWINWTLFSFEINIRASVIVGLVGGGGIGVLINTNINLFRYQEAMGIIILVVTLVLITEYLTGLIRKRIA